MGVRIAPRTLVVLVGASGAGKSHWAAENFARSAVVSSDALRGVVGEGQHDQRASTDAFELLDLIIQRRLARGLLTVIDTLGLDPVRRSVYLELARREGFRTVAVVFDTPADVCKARNRARAHPVPPKVLGAQIQSAASVRIEGFDEVVGPSDVELVGGEMVGAPAGVAAQSRAPVTLRFGLQLSSFGGSGPSFAARLAEIASVAEAVGFSSIWVMDHVMQIPQVGRPWEDMPESWTTLAWLAARTQTARLGTLVTGVTLRNPAHLAKIVATVDVLSEGRAICGLGAAWWKHEHETYGWEFPPVAARLDLLEDVLQLLPVMWGPGAPAFKGAVLSVPETVCYPRPVQEHVPILVGGSGERRTLSLVARYADACNLFGDPSTVAHKVAVLASHCAAVGRDPADVRVTHLSTAVVAGSRREVDAAVARLGGGDAARDRLGAGTVEDQVGRYRALAEAGVQTAMVALPDVAVPGCLEAMGAVIEAFPSTPGW